MGKLSIDFRYIAESLGSIRDGALYDMSKYLRGKIDEIEDLIEKLIELPALCANPPIEITRHEDTIKCYRTTLDILKKIYAEFTPSIENQLDILENKILGMADFVEFE